jgi:hypothetical protein
MPDARTRRKRPLPVDDELPPSYEESQHLQGYRSKEPREEEVVEDSEEYTTDDYLEEDEVHHSYESRQPTSGVRLKRKFMSEEYAVKHEWLEDCFQHWNFQKDDFVECFASRQNHRLAAYWTRSQNSFSKDWSQYNLYCNPPFSLLPQVTLKMLADKITLMLLVVPVWVGACWWEVLGHFVEEFVEYPKGMVFFELWDDKRRRMVDSGPLQWPVRVCLCSFTRFVQSIGTTGTQSKRRAV